jgi:hypothetical protein
LVHWWVLVRYGQHKEMFLEYFCFGDKIFLPFYKNKPMECFNCKNNKWRTSLQFQVRKWMKISNYPQHMTCYMHITWDPFPLFSQWIWNHCHKIHASVG